MEQPTFADLEFENKKRKTRREMFLERMDELIPWQRLEARIHPYYPKAGRGRRPLCPVGNAAGALRAGILQSERPGDGRPAV